MCGLESGGRVGKFELQGCGVCPAKTMVMTATTKAARFSRAEVQDRQQIYGYGLAGKRTSWRLKVVFEGTRQNPRTMDNEAVAVATQISGLFGKIKISGSFLFLVWF
ncbi:hypothetical protein OROGR_011815 [Orobanche gracilis]